MRSAAPVHVHTYSGIAFDLRDPTPAMVRLDDIVHSLSLMNRFNGAALFPYSVAQHSLHVASLLPAELRLEGLLHDAAEAYIGDMVSPLKQVMPEYKSVEARIAAVVAEVFGLRYPEPSEVKQADLSVLAAEREQVLQPSYGPWFKDFPEPAPITITQRDWLEVKASFASSLQAEIATRQAQTMPVAPSAQRRLTPRVTSSLLHVIAEDTTSSTIGDLSEQRPAIDDGR